MKAVHLNARCAQQDRSVLQKVLDVRNVQPELKPPSIVSLCSVIPILESVCIPCKDGFFNP